MCGGIEPGGQRHQRVRRAMQDERRRADLAQQGAAIPRCHDGQQLALGSLAIKSAPGDTLEMAAQRRRVLRNSRAADDSEYAQQVFRDGLDVRGRRRGPKQGPKRPARAEGHLALRVPGPGHDRGQADHAPRVPRGKDLRDHPAHRRAHHVGSRDTQRVQQADRVRGHVVQVVGRAHLEPQQGPGDRQRHAAAADAAQPRGPAAVTIVEVHDPESLRRQTLDHRIRPQGRRHSKPHDEQHGGRQRVAVHAVVEFDSIRLHRRHRQSSRLPARRCPAVTRRAARPPCRRPPASSSAASRPPRRPAPRAR